MKLTWTRPNAWQGFNYWVIHGWNFYNRHGIREHGLVLLGWELTWEEAQR